MGNSKIVDACKIAIKYRFKEITLCLENGAYLAVILLAGSSIEGLLYSLAVDYGVPKCNEMSFESLIEWAYNKKMISEVTKLNLHKIRDYRNSIHVKLDIKKNKEINLETAMECVPYLESAIDEIYAFLEQNEVLV